jgi:ribonuclease BN (tRNA processing enzyme)
MKPNSIASADENTEEISNEDNSLDNENEDFDDADDIENEDYENSNDFKQKQIKKQHQTQHLNTSNVEDSDSSSFSVRKINKNKLNKKRKCRTTFTKIQLNTLECEFVKNNFVSNDRLESIVKMTELDPRIIKVNKILHIIAFLNVLKLFIQIELV